MSEDTDDLVGLRGAETTGPRWAEFRALNNAAARLINEGRNTEAVAKLQEAYEKTLVEDVDAAGLDGRARALANLAGLAENRGDPDEALRLTAEALNACEAAEADAGDRYGTRAVRASLLINRAQTLQLVGRLDEALADLDTALASIESSTAEKDNGVLNVMLHNTKTVLLIGLERWDEAEATAKRTLELATLHEPRLAGHPYSNLAVIAQSLNDHAAAIEYLRLAEQLHQGDPVSEALAVANQGRAALRIGDLATGDRLLAQAEQTFSEVEQPLRAAEIRYGRAYAALYSGDPARARELLVPAIAILRDAGHASILAEAQALLGDLYASEAKFDEAEAAYLESRATHEASGARYHLARIDMRRGYAITARRGLTVIAEDQYRLLRQAFDLALPAALATDAIRHQFASGRAREQWASTVAIPAMAHALHLATALHDAPLISELLEHMCATVSLHAPDGTQPFNPPLDEPTDADAPTLSTPDDLRPLPFTASALVTGISTDFPADRFALPPRLRVNPWRPSPLEPWIQETERRYGFAIRSDEMVHTW
ncbi:lipopolysaccharide assembly protein LapB [Glycomyces sp. NRRL B-16210]|uniref:tetratricopeptide repeat protein n=1 Tax=Glycomyces sp. NRRL B-16210 TaxID=1463821 RepID=UPI0004C1F772|nr:tetratricopeptide repeat protein [Glycomyces sp. NRRL B-16210]